MLYLTLTYRKITLNLVPKEKSTDFLSKLIAITSLGHHFMKPIDLKITITHKRCVHFWGNFHKANTQSFKNKNTHSKLSQIYLL